MSLSEHSKYAILSYNWIAFLLRSHSKKSDRRSTDGFIHWEIQNESDVSCYKCQLARPKSLCKYAELNDTHNHCFSGCYWNVLAWVSYVKSITMTSISILHWDYLVRICFWCWPAVSFFSVNNQIWHFAIENAPCMDQ